MVIIIDSSTSNNFCLGPDLCLEDWGDVKGLTSKVTISTSRSRISVFHRHTEVYPFTIKFWKKVFTGSCYSRPTHGGRRVRQESPPAGGTRHRQTDTGSYGTHRPGQRRGFGVPPTYPPTPDSTGSVKILAQGIVRGPLYSFTHGFRLMDKGDIWPTPRTHSITGDFWGVKGINSPDIVRTGGVSQQNFQSHLWVCFVSRTGCHVYHRITNESYTEILKSPLNPISLEELPSLFVVLSLKIKYCSLRHHKTY